MPCFVIHWHAYFPAGLFYLLPGPCLPCSKFDVSGYQFIPTWNKEKFTVRDEQHHTQEHHQNPTLEHTSSSHIRFVFSHVVHFSLQTIWQYFSLFPSISLPSPPQACHVPQEPCRAPQGVQCLPTQTLQWFTGREAPPQPAEMPSMISHRRTSHAGADTRSGLLWFCFQLFQVLFVPLDPCEKEWLLLRRSCAAWA